MAKNVKKACWNGHTFTPENSYIDKNGYRSCKDCRRIRTKKERDSWKPPKQNET